MANNKVDIFTTAMRTEFLTAYEEVAVPAEYRNFVTTLPSNGRIEHYPWLSPVAPIDQYLGHRRTAKIGEIMYDVVNLEWDSSFEVLLRDIQDDQTGGYMLKSRELASRAKNLPGRQALIQLANGKTRKCFDTSAFFATSHVIGTVNNLMTYTGTANSDGLTYNFMVLITTAPVKPVIWQQRKDPDLQNDMDVPGAKFSKVARFWLDMEGAAAFGRPHDAILMQVTNAPSVTDLQLALGQIEDQFRTFKLPSALASAGNQNEFIHEQLVFGPDTATIICASTLGNKFRQVLNQDTIVQSGAAISNIFKGFAGLVPSGLINTVS